MAWGVFLRLFAWPLAFWLLGRGSTRALLILTALATAGGYDWRGWSATESDPGLETHHFRTPVAASGTVLVV